MSFQACEGKEKTKLAQMYQIEVISNLFTLYLLYAYWKSWNASREHGEVVMR